MGIRNFVCVLICEVDITSCVRFDNSKSEVKCTMII